MWVYTDMYMYIGIFLPLSISCNSVNDKGPKELQFKLTDICIYCPYQTASGSHLNPLTTVGKYILVLVDIGILLYSGVPLYG